MKPKANVWVYGGNKIENIAAEISKLDQTKWTALKTRLFHKTPKTGRSWISKILRGLPHENKGIQRSYAAAMNFYNKKQYEAIRAEFLFLINTIENYVGPKLIDPPLSWRNVRKINRIPNLFYGLTNGGRWIKILDVDEAKKISTLMTNLIRNDFRYKG